jgi:hypothetical protein
MKRHYTWGFILFFIFPSWVLQNHVRARRRDCAQRSVYLTCRIRRPIRGWQAACAHCSVDVIMLCASDVIAVLLVIVLCCHNVGWHTHWMRMFPSCFQVPLSYLPEAGSGETDGARATLGEAESCQRWETLEEMSQFLRVARLSPLGGFRPCFSECVC